MFIFLFFNVYEVIPSIIGIEKVIGNEYLYQFDGPTKQTKNTRYKGIRLTIYLALFFNI